MEAVKTAAEKTAEEAQKAQSEAEKAQAAAEKAAEEQAETAMTEAADAKAAREKAEQEKAEAILKAEEEKANADMMAASKVIEKINEIGTVEKINSCENAIVAARSAYDALTDEQKVLVTNYEILVSAEKEYNAIPQTGYSGIHKVLAGFAALMGIAGAGLVKKSRRKEDEE